jgi:hypothetical protein
MTLRKGIQTTARLPEHLLKLCQMIGRALFAARRNQSLKRFKKIPLKNLRGKILIPQTTY